MKLVILLMIFFAPMVGWTQTEGISNPTIQGRPTEPAKAVSITNLPVTREVSLADIFDRLGLNAQQQVAWDVFKSRVDAYISAYYRQKPVVPSQEDAAPHQIGRMVDNLQNRLAALEEIEAAAKSLYAVLKPEQQKAANEILILAIPTFTSTGNESMHSNADARRKDNKPDAGKRSRRGPGGAGMNGSMPEN